MSKLVAETDLKSVGQLSPCGFDSRSEYDEWVGTNTMVIDGPLPNNMIINNRYGIYS